MAAIEIWVTVVDWKENDSLFTVIHHTNDEAVRYAKDHDSPESILKLIQDGYGSVPWIGSIDGRKIRCVTEYKQISVTVQLERRLNKLR